MQRTKTLCDTVDTSDKNEKIKLINYHEKYFDKEE